MKNFSIGYKGKVNVKKYRRGKLRSSQTYHNNGTQDLYKFLCAAIAGVSDGSSLEPISRLDLGYVDAVTGKWVSILSLQPLTNNTIEPATVSGSTTGESTESSDAGYNAVFSTYLYSTNLNTQAIDNAAENAILTYALMSENNGTPVPMAYVKAISGEAGRVVKDFNISPDETYQVTWVMNICGIDDDNEYSTEFQGVDEERSGS